MKLLAIGDPHGNVETLRKIPTQGVGAILVTGDIGNADLARKFAFERVEREKQGIPKQEETADEARQVYMQIYDSAVSVMQYLGNIAPVYTIYGNVEPSNAEVKKDMKKHGLDLPLLTDTLKSLPNVHIINNKVVRFGSIKVGGLEYFVDTQWVKEFKPGDYKRRLARATKQTVRAKKVLNRFGNVDVLVFHQPPYGLLDTVGDKAPQHWRGKHAGSPLILDYLKKHQPKYGFCGHIHEGEGMAKIGKTEVYNLGVCGYKIIEL